MGPYSTFIRKSKCAIKLHPVWRRIMLSPCTNRHLCCKRSKVLPSAVFIYSRTSIARTPMARLQWLIRTRFLSLHAILPIAQENKSLENFSYFIMKLYVICTFAMANSNSFLSPHAILPIAQENKCLENFSYFIMKLYVICTR